MTELPPLYALVHPGLESIAADEITRDLGGAVKKQLRGQVVFRVEHLSGKVLRLRTTEDVFLLAWGTDSLTYRAEDLQSIRRWTAKAKWEPLFRLLQTLRPRKGKPTVRLVTQMQGEHGYRRVDAREALAAGLRRHVPEGWQPVEENAWLEIWLTISGGAAVCGVRLSDRTMRHRTWKVSHIAASLRPTVAAAMVRLAGVGPGMVLLDSFCGAGTILAEQLELSRQRHLEATLIGSDLDAHAVHCAGENLQRLGEASLLRADARALPLASESVDRIVSNPPFGKQLSSLEEIGPLYQSAVREWGRVLKPGGRAVVLVAEAEVLRGAVPRDWRSQRQLRVRILGQPAVLSVWQKGA